MTTISDERLAEIDGLVSKLNHLVSLDQPENGGPYHGVAARECLSAMQQAAVALQSLRAQEGVRAVQRIASILEHPSGSPAHDLGAIRQALSSLEASPAPVSEELQALRDFANSFHVTVVEDSFYKDVTLHLDSPHALSIRIRNDSSKSWLFKDLEERRRAALAQQQAEQARDVVASKHGRNATQPQSWGEWERAKQEAERK